MRTYPSLAALLVGLAIALPAGASAASQASAHKAATFTGVGSATVSTAEGTATFAGPMSGSPFSGELAGRLVVTDGSFPTIGACEPATAEVALSDTRKRTVDVAAVGQVCAVLLPLGVIHDFSGRFTIQQTTERRLRGMEGVTQIRILGTRSDVYISG